MTLQEIQEAVRAGKIVHWMNDGYTVRCTTYRSGGEQWLIECQNGHCIGLTWADDVTMNGKPNEFYIGGQS